MNPEDPRYKDAFKDFVQREQKFWVPFQYQIPPSDLGLDKSELEKQRDCRVEPTLLNYTLMEHSVSSKYLRKPGSLFWDFLTCVIFGPHDSISRLISYRFWRIGITVSATFALSVGQNKYLKRQHPPLKDRQREQVNPRIFHNIERATQQVYKFDYKSPTFNPAMHPLTWPWQALVVQDPFITTYVSLDCLLIPLN